MFNGIYKGKTVLVTGHTGFKGSWLSTWLISLGARVVGYSIDLPSSPCNFSTGMMAERLIHIEGDIRNLEAMRETFVKHRPDIVFHLAAQPIVRASYREPKLTFDTNLGGTVNVLECIKAAPGIKAAVIITSDKCYKNVEWVWGYRENDALGGDDPYSASKACAEIAANSYIKSFFGSPGSANISTVRAGNVIGGGDWASDRIIPDCVRAWSEGREAVIRAPDATRPWQHVLEPLSGYLWLGANLYSSGNFHGEAFNFGPDATVNQPVRVLIDTFVKYWGNGAWRQEEAGAFKESTLLKLSCDKALHFLRWHPVLTFDETVKMTAEWYKSYYGGRKDTYLYSVAQIEYYAAKAVEQGLQWTAMEGE